MGRKGKAPILDCDWNRTGVLEKRRGNTREVIDKVGRRRY